MTLATIVGFVVFMVLLLFGCQRKLIYIPRPYEVPLKFLASSGGKVEILNYETSQGRQVAFYLPPRRGSDAPPDAVWFLYGGNASRALDWLTFAEQTSDPDAAFFMVDYPGYGYCEGRPTRKTILETLDRSLSALAEHLKLERPVLESRLSVLGHSIGAAVALEMAASVPTTRRIVLISPFTTLVAMARRTVGWPLCYLLIDRFDNPARMAEIASRDPRPPVTIVHGAADAIIPFKMGSTLAEAHPDWIVFHAIENGDHNGILDLAERQINEAMLPEKVSTTDDTESKLQP